MALKKIHLKLNSRFMFHRRNFSLHCFETTLRLTKSSLFSNTALKRSKRRVSSVILSGELDLDVPLLPCTFGGGITPSCAPSAINQADGGPHLDSWRRVFESMDRALALEGDKLVSPPN